uniref:Uncharacterized protein n=1 Tax=Moniliophthora roreri TaxID=221103 RepID=A0A0W0GBL4_MONRR
MEASCSYADTTIVFHDVENPRIAILGSLGTGVIVERLSTSHRIIPYTKSTPPPSFLPATAPQMKPLFPSFTSGIKHPRRFVLGVFGL